MCIRKVGHLEFFQGLWKRRLENKFKNCRRRLDKSIDEIAAKKRKRPNADNDVPSVAKSFQWGLENFLPGETEDQESLEMYQLQLTQQDRLTDAKQDKFKIKKALERTFAHRRKIIVQENAKVERVKELYPGLFNEEEVGNQNIVNIIK